MQTLEATTDSRTGGNRTRKQIMQMCAGSQPETEPGRKYGKQTPEAEPKQTLKVTNDHFY